MKLPFPTKPKLVRSFLGAQQGHRSLHSCWYAILANGTPEHLQLSCLCNRLAIGDYTPSLIVGYFGSQQSCASASKSSCNSSCTFRTQLNSWQISNLECSHKTCSSNVSTHRDLNSFPCVNFKDLGASPHVLGSPPHGAPPFSRHGFTAKDISLQYFLGSCKHLRRFSFIHSMKVHDCRVSFNKKQSLQGCFDVGVARREVNPLWERMRLWHPTTVTTT